MAKKDKIAGGITACAGCGKTLTDENGRRLCSGNFDSSLATPAATEHKTFAWCNECYAKVKRKSRSKSKSINAEIWETRGILPEGHEICDAAMPHFLEGIRIAGELAARVYNEAMFQAKALPKCTKSFRKTHTWKKE